SGVQAWSDGFANRGWNIRPDNGTGVMSQTDGILFSSAEDPTSGNRPLLTVTYVSAVPEPGALFLTGLGLATFGAARYRRGGASQGGGAQKINQQKQGGPRRLCRAAGFCPAPKPPKLSPVFPPDSHLPTAYVTESPPSRTDPPADRRACHLHQGDRTCWDNE